MTVSVEETSIRNTQELWLTFRLAPRQICNENREPALRQLALLRSLSHDIGNPIRNDCSDRDNAVFSVCHRTFASLRPLDF